MLESGTAKNMEIVGEESEEIVPKRQRWRNLLCAEPKERVLEKG